ncbi:hypothetical protein [Alkalihalobacillus pseudalcaliphilus]|uniref:hypothetical protein n=1 Tax=Alkalihalobacillus pseudalcaliphilus TaxID=79884 RepID=UPI00064DA9EA|nr:hypothetical protein [Alkalihalobacillus pseudalcaliphilus]
MNAQRLTEIRERAAKATDGAWRATLDDPYYRTYVLGSFNKGVHVIADIKGDNNADFIAHARTDVEDLLAEVERLSHVVAVIKEMAEEGYVTAASIDEAFVCDIFLQRLNEELNE